MKSCRQKENTCFIYSLIVLAAFWPLCTQKMKTPLQAHGLASNNENLSRELD